MDRKSVMEEVKQNGMALEYVPDPFKNDKKIVMAAVQQNGWALQYADFQDKDIVMAAVQQYGPSLRYAPEFQEDKDVVMAAVKQDGTALRYAPAFQDDKEFVMVAVKKNGWVLEYADFQDKDVVMAAVKENGLALEYAEFQDREVVMAAVHQNGMALKFAGILRADPKIACSAVRNSPHALRFVDHSLDKNNEFIKCMMKYNVDPGGRAVLKGHIMDRQSLKNTAKSLIDPMKVVNDFLGGTRKRRKRTRRR